MTKVTRVNRTASKVMIGLRYSADGVRALELIQKRRDHEHFSETLAEALDQYIGRELPAALPEAA